MSTFSFKEGFRVQKLLKKFQKIIKFLKVKKKDLKVISKVLVFVLANILSYYQGFSYKKPNLKILSLKKVADKSY